MAAATITVVSPNASTSVLDHLPAKTSMRGLIDGTAPITLGKGLKASFVKFIFDNGDYASGGVEAGLLDALPGWTAVLAAVPQLYLDNTTLHIASYNPATDKVLVHVMTTGAEHAASALTAASTVTMLVLGY